MPARQPKRSSTTPASTRTQLDALSALDGDLVRVDGLIVPADQVADLCFQRLSGIGSVDIGIETSRVFSVDHDGPYLRHEASLF